MRILGPMISFLLAVLINYTYGAASKFSADIYSLADSSEDAGHLQEPFSELLSSILKVPVFRKVLLPLSPQILFMIINIELLTISTGDHFGITMPPPDPVADLELHRNAMAIMELWFHLQTMEKVEKALQSAIIKVGEMIGRVPDLNYRIIQLTIENVEQILNSDEILSKKLLDAKTRVNNEFATEKTYFRGKRLTAKKEGKIFKKWFSHPKVKKFIVNKLFLLYCLNRLPTALDPEYDRTIMAKAVVALSNVQNRTIQVNRIYEEVITSMADNFNAEHYPFYTSSSALGSFSPGAFAYKMAPELFEILSRKFQEVTELNSELQDIKKNVIEDDPLKDSSPLISQAIF